MLICRIWGFFAEKKSTTFCHRIYLASQYITMLLASAYIRLPSLPYQEIHVSIWIFESP